MANTSDLKRELDKRLNAIYTMNDLYDISNLIKAFSEEADRTEYTAKFQAVAFKKISEGHPNSDAIAKIVLKHING